MTEWPKRMGLFLVILFAVLGAASAGAQATGDPSANEVLILDLEGPINPGSALYVERGILEAELRGAALVILRVDTPGGLASSMRTMVKAILNSPVPVVVYVGPRGAGAASAGVMVTVAGHVAAMAPGTNIGAAHPVTAGGKDMQEEMSKKVVNDMASYGRGIAEEKGRNGEWVEEAIRDYSGTVLVVSHDIGFVSSFVNRVACVNRFVETHRPAEMTGESIEALYGAPMRMVHQAHHHREDER